MKPRTYLLQAGLQLIMEDRKITGIVLAAGKSTRMKSPFPDVLRGRSKLSLELAGKPIIKYVTDVLLESGFKRIIVIVNHDAERLKQILGDSFEYVSQKELLGTGHALMQVRDYLANYVGDIFVTVGDSPFLTSQIIKTLTNKHCHSKAAATLLTAVYDNPPEYGRIIRDKNGALLKIVETKDATPEQLEIKEVNTSHYYFKAEIVLPLLSELKNDNAEREYYLPDIIEILLKCDYKVETICAEDSTVGLAVNTQEQFVEAEKIIRKKRK